MPNLSWLALVLSLSAAAQAVPVASSFPDTTWDDTCPVQVWSVQRAATDNVYVRWEARVGNYTDKKIKESDWSLFGLTSTAQVAEEDFNHQKELGAYSDTNIKFKLVSSGQISLSSPPPSTHAYFVYPRTITYSDGEVWTNPHFRCGYIYWNEDKAKRKEYQADRDNHYRAWKESRKTKTPR